MPGRLRNFEEHFEGVHGLKAPVASEASNRAGPDSELWSVRAMGMADFASWQDAEVGLVHGPDVRVLDASRAWVD